MVHRCDRLCTSIRYSLSSVFENWDILELYLKKTPKPLYRRIQYIHSMHKLPRPILYYWSYNLNHARKLGIAYTWLRSWISWMNWSYVSDLSSVTVENLLVIWSTTERARLRITNPALIWFCPIFQLWCYLDNKDREFQGYLKHKCSPVKSMPPEVANLFRIYNININIKIAHSNLFP